MTVRVHSAGVYEDSCARGVLRVPPPAHGGVLAPGVLLGPFILLISVTFGFAPKQLFPVFIHSSFPVELLFKISLRCPLPLSSSCCAWEVSWCRPHECPPISISVESSGLVLWPSWTCAFSRCLSKRLPSPLSNLCLS